MSPRPILEIKDLRVSFLDPHNASQTIEAVKDANLALEEGAFTSIVGESGSGKSVTSLSITRLTKPHQISGEILWRGGHHEKNLLALNEKELLGIRGKEIAYVFQDPGSSLNPVLRVGPQIAETYRAHFDVDANQAQNRALELIAAVQMRDANRVYQSYPHELSGGMRQRAMIAMALIAEPKLLIADEPTTALDSEVEKEILRLLVKIKEERKLTILFITHDMGHASAFSDRIYVMGKGEIAEKLERSAQGFLPKSEDAKKLFSASFWNVPAKSLLEI